MNCPNPPKRYAMKRRLPKRWQSENIKKSKLSSETDEKKIIGKRAPTAYMLFCNTHRPTIVNENPGIEFAAISKNLGEMWQTLSNKQKLAWRKKAQRRTMMKESSMISTDKNPCQLGQESGPEGEGHPGIRVTVQRSPLSGGEEAPLGPSEEMKGHKKQNSSRMKQTNVREEAEEVDGNDLVTCAEPICVVDNYSSLLDWESQTPVLVLDDIMESNPELRQPLEAEGLVNLKDIKIETLRNNDSVVISEHKGISKDTFSPDSETILDSLKDEPCEKEIIASTSLDNQLLHIDLNDLAHTITNTVSNVTAYVVAIVSKDMSRLESNIKLSIKKANVGSNSQSLKKAVVEEFSIFFDQMVNHIIEVKSTFKKDISEILSEHKQCTKTRINLENPNLLYDSGIVSKDRTIRVCSKSIKKRHLNLKPSQSYDGSVKDYAAQQHEVVPTKKIKLGPGSSKPWSNVVLEGGQLEPAKSRLKDRSTEQLNFATVKVKSDIEEDNNFGCPTNDWIEKAEIKKAKRKRLGNSSKEQIKFGRLRQCSKFRSRKNFGKNPLFYEFHTFSMGNPCPICIEDNSSNIQYYQRYVRTFFLRHLHYDINRGEILTPSGQVWEEVIRSFVQHNQAGRLARESDIETKAATDQKNLPGEASSECESDKFKTPAVDSPLNHRNLEQSFLANIKSLIALDDFASTCFVCKIRLWNKEELLIHCSEKHPAGLGHGNVSYEKVRSMKKSPLEKVFKGNACPVCNTYIICLPRLGRLWNEGNKRKSQRYRNILNLKKVKAHFMQHFYYDVERDKITTTSGQVWSDVVSLFLQQYHSMESSLLDDVQQLETQSHKDISASENSNDDKSIQSNISLIKQEKDCFESVDLEKLPSEAVEETNCDSLKGEEDSKAHPNSDPQILVSEGGTEECEKQNGFENIDKVLLEQLNSLITPDDFVLACLVCKIRFRDNSAFFIHNQNKHPRREAVYIDGEKKMKFCRTACLECGMQFASHAEYKTHNREQHGKTFTCDICQMQLTTINGFNKHKLIHEREKSGGLQVIGQKTYVCEVCGEDIISLRKYQQHLAMHKGDPNPYKCPKCPSSFPREIELTNHHLVTHKIHKERTHVCHECGKDYSRAQDLKRHIYSNHVKPKNVPLISGKVRTNRVGHGLYSRKIQPENKRKGAFRCSVCQEEHQDMTFHLETCHTDGLNCLICHNFTSKKRYRLLEHMRSKHGDRQTETCEVCHKTFANKHCLTSHMTVHTGDKPFECDVCHQRFRIKSYLPIHYRIHTGEKPHVCGVCGMKFRQKGDLNGHVKRHKKKGEWSQSTKEEGPQDDTSTKGEVQHKVTIDNSEQDLTTEEHARIPPITVDIVSPFAFVLS